MPKTRRLADLYVVGKEVTLDDGDGPVTIWMQKLNPVDHESALRNANAVRARVLAARKDHDSLDYVTLRSDVEDQSRDELLMFLSFDAVQTRSEAIEAELAAENEWSDSNYLQGLMDSWQGGLKDVYAADPENADAKHVHDEMDRWATLLQDRIEAEREGIVRDLDLKTDEELQDQVLERTLRVNADMSWLAEYHRCEVWLSVRDPEHHKQKYFARREDVDDLPQEVLLVLISEYRDLTVEPTEGKDLPGTPASSEPSVPSEKEEASPTPGPMAVSL